MGDKNENEEKRNKLTFLTLNKIKKKLINLYFYTFILKQNKVLGLTHLNILLLC